MLQARQQLKHVLDVLRVLVLLHECIDFLKEFPRVIVDL